MKTITNSSPRIFAQLRETGAFVLIIVGLVDVTVAADRPNILFMMSDDQAWNGLSVAMHPNWIGRRVPL
jgi:hypothetical protein